MYVKITNGSVDTYPYSIGQLRRDNPNTSFPKKVSEETLASYGVYPVTVADEPKYTERTQKIEQDSVPKLVDGSWIITRTVSDKTAEEIAQYDEGISSRVRSQRNHLLMQTDYLALSDNTLSVEMASYRQALRDITAHENFPYLEESDWPVKP